VIYEASHAVTPRSFLGLGLIRGRTQEKPLFRGRFGGKEQSAYHVHRAALHPRQHMSVRIERDAGLGVPSRSLTTLIGVPAASNSAACD
jgi:hypothetical protein